MPTLLGDSDQYPGAYDVQHDDGTTGTYPASTILSHPELGPQALLMAAKDPSITGPALQEATSTPGSHIGEMLAKMTQGSTTPAAPYSGPMAANPPAPAAPSMDTNFAQLPPQQHKDAGGVKPGEEARLAAAKGAPGPGHQAMIIAPGAVKFDQTPYTQDATAIGELGNAQAAQQTAVGNVTNTTLNQVEQQQKDMQLARQQSQQVVDQAANAADQKWFDLGNTHIDPTKAISSPWQKALAVLSMGIGGFYGGYSGTGKNPGADIIHDAIKTDVEAQEKNLETKRFGAQRADSRVQLLRQAGMDDQTARHLAMSQELQTMAARVTSVSASTQGAIDIAQNKHLQAALLEKAQQEKILAYDAYYKNAAEGGKASLDYTQALNAGGPTGPDQFALKGIINDPNASNEIKHEAIPYLTPENAKTVVNNGPRVQGTAASGEQADKVNEGNVNTLNLKDAIAAFRPLAKKALENNNTLLDDTDNAKAEVLEKRIRQLMTYGQKGEGEQARLTPYAADLIEGMAPQHISRNPLAGATKSLLFHEAHSRLARLDALEASLGEHTERENEERNVTPPAAGLDLSNTRRLK